MNMTVQVTRKEFAYVADDEHTVQSENAQRQHEE